MTESTPAKTTPVRTSVKQTPVIEEDVVAEAAPDGAVVVEGVALEEAVAGDQTVVVEQLESAPGLPPVPEVAVAAPKPARKPAGGRASSSSAKAPAQARPATGPRRVRLSVSRVDPWSVMKLAFLLSVGLGIMTVVAVAIAWRVVDSMGVFADLESLLFDLGALEQFSVILDYLRLKNVMSMAVVVSIVNVALMTALATLAAFLYNIVAALVGGLHVTLTDD